MFLQNRKKRDSTSLEKEDEDRRHKRGGERGRKEGRKIRQLIL